MAKYPYAAPAVPAWNVCISLSALKPPLRGGWHYLPVSSRH